MIERITYIETNSTLPYRNLALEEHLLLNCRENECILYLWQNQQTVVIGRNQNAWKECLVSRLEEDGGRLARRLSGGGAVYHDLGNLNFTFLVHKPNYNVDKQLQVIIEGVRKLGIPAEKSGRNDILAAGRKFSGNAFYEQKSFCYHHGTIMVDVNIGELSKYLTVSKEKLKSKGVDSVKSRVANLKDFVPGLTIDRLKEVLQEAFEEVYELKAGIIKETDLDIREIERLTEKLASREWKFGRKIPFEYELSHRFTWGDLTCQFHVEAGKLMETAVFSDSMKPEIMLKLPEYLNGVDYTKSAIDERLSGYQPADQQEKEMISDIRDWIKTVDL